MGGLYPVIPSLGGMLGVYSVYTGRHAGCVYPVYTERHAGCVLPCYQRGTTRRVLSRVIREGQRGAYYPPTMVENMT